MDRKVSVTGVLVRLILEEHGQDLIEYGLLAGIFGVAAALVFPGILAKMGTNFRNWGTQVRNIWTPGNPQ